MIGIILYRPEKPGNVGNIIRTCMASEARLYIIGPLTFSLTTKELQRAGMDYIKESDFVLYKDFNEFTAVVFDILNHKTGLGFTTFSHTGNPVPVFAVGVGCGAFSDLNNNIEIPQKIRKLTGLAD